VSEASQESSPQANISAQEDALPFGAVFWVMLVLTGIGAGIAAGLLMKLLRIVQHVSFRYHSGTFLEAVLGTSPAHRVLVLFAAALIGGPSIWGLHRIFGSEGGLVSSIWFRSGRLPNDSHLLERRVVHRHGGNGSFTGARIGSQGSGRGARARTAEPWAQSSMTRKSMGGAVPGDCEGCCRRGPSRDR
jgi:hypothetical protein